MINPGGKKQNGDPNLVNFYFLFACDVQNENNYNY